MGNSLGTSNIVVIAIVAVLIILGLVALNVFLIFWVCRRNRNASRSMELALPPKSLKSLESDGKIARKKLNSPQTVTLPARKSKTKGYANTDVKKKKSYETSKQIGKCAKSVKDDEYSEFDKLDRGKRSSNPEAGLADYGQLRVKMNSGEYDSTCFIKSKETSLDDGWYDSTAKLKEKPRAKPVRDKFKMTEEIYTTMDTPKVDPRKCSLDTNKLSEAKGAEYETLFPITKVNESQSTLETQGGKRSEANTTNDYTNTVTTVEAGDIKEKEEVKPSIEIQTCMSFLQEKAKQKARVLRQSAGTQVDDADFESECEESDYKGDFSSVFE